MRKGFELGGAINKRKLTNIQNISTEFGLYYHKALLDWFFIYKINIWKAKKGKKVASPGNWTRASWVTAQGANH